MGVRAVLQNGLDKLLQPAECSGRIGRRPNANWRLLGANIRRCTPGAPKLEFGQLVLPLGRIEIEGAMDHDLWRKLSQEILVHEGSTPRLCSQDDRRPTVSAQILAVFERSVDSHISGRRKDIRDDQDLIIVGAFPIHHFTSQSRTSHKLELQHSRGQKVRGMR